MKRAATAAVLFLLLPAIAVGANDYGAKNDFLGSIAASGEICGTAIDNGRQIALIRTLADETSHQLNAGTVYMASRRVLRERVSWSEEKQADFCAWAKDAANKLGLLLD